MEFSQLKRGDETVIVGTGGFALELAGLFHDLGIKVLGCIGPEAPSPEARLTYLGGDEKISQFKATPFVVALGQPNLRKQLFASISETGGHIASFIHPNAQVSSATSVGEGVIVYPNTTVHAGGSLSRGVFVNSNVTIGHESQIGAFSNIGPGASLGGKVCLGDLVYVGIGACIIEEISVASGTVVGAGAVVVKDCIPAGTYIGVPACRKDS